MENLSHVSNASDNTQDQALPLPGTDAYETLPQFLKRSVLPFRRTIRRHELRKIVPLSETTIYELERRGEFPRRFNLTPRSVVWDLDEVQVWIDDRKKNSRSSQANLLPDPGPDVRLRKYRPMR